MPRRTGGRRWIRGADVGPWSEVPLGDRLTPGSPDQPLNLAGSVAQEPAPSGYTALVVPQRSRPAEDALVVDRSVASRRSVTAPSEDARPARVKRLGRFRPVARRSSGDQPSRSSRRPQSSARSRTTRPMIALGSGLHPKGRHQALAGRARPRSAGSVWIQCGDGSALRVTEMVRLLLSMG